MFVVGVTLTVREIQNTKWPSNSHRQILALSAVIVNDEVPFSWREYLPKSGAILDLLETDNLRIQLYDDLPKR